MWLLESVDLVKVQIYKESNYWANSHRYVFVIA